MYMTVEYYTTGTFLDGFGGWGGPWGGGRPVTFILRSNCCARPRSCGDQDGATSVIWGSMVVEVYPDSEG